MAQTLAEMLEEFGEVGAKNPWLNVHAYAALKQAQALQGIEAQFRLRNTMQPLPRALKEGK